MSTTPTDNLELRALEERRQLHERATELKSKISETRDNLSLTNQSRQHFTPAALIAGAVAILAGYMVAGIFTER